MTRYGNWTEAERRLRESRPEPSDADWHSRRQAARAVAGEVVHTGR
ncbi:hypothetical protein ACFY3N_08900 [Streptomyces sp. NPDC000348]